MSIAGIINTLRFRPALIFRPSLKLRRGCLLALFCFYGADSRAQIRINELQIAPVESGFEFVEIISVSTVPLDITLISLEDSRARPGLISFQENDSKELNPGETLVLAQNPELLRGVHGSIRIASIKPWPALNNGGDKIIVRHETVKQDSLFYGSNDYTRGISLERIDPNVPARFKGNWAPSTAAAGATPGRQNSVFKLDTDAVSIRLAEYSSDRSIDVYFSEPIDFTRLSDDGVRLDDKPYDGILSVVEPAVLRLLPVHPVNQIQFDALSDFAGNTSGPLSRDVAQRVSTGDLVISEIMFDPSRDTNGDLASEWVEFVNIRSFPLSLVDLSLTVGPLNSKSVSSNVLETPYMEIAPGQFVLVYSEPAGATRGGLFSNSEYSSIAIYLEAFENALGLQINLPLLLPVSGSSLSLNNSGDVVTLLMDPVRVVDSVVYKAAWHDDRISDTRGRSLSRIRVEAKSMEPLNWVTSRSGAGYAGFTPGADRTPDGSFVSQFPGPGDVVFSEIMFDPLAVEGDGLPDQSEFLEIRNTSGWEVDLNGFYLTSGAEDRLTSDSLRLIYRPERLGPDEIAVIFNLPAYISDDERKQRQFIEAAFPQIQSRESLRLIPIRSALSLSNSGEHLALFAGNGENQDILSYDISWHHPLVTDATGRSLEKIDIAQPSSIRSNWSTAAAPQGGTPGTRNSIENTSALSGDNPGLEISPPTITPDRDGVDDHAEIIVSGGSSNSVLRIDIYDLEGRLVRKLTEPTLYTGNYVTFWNGLGDGARRLPPGVYITFVQIHERSTGTNITYKKPVGIFWN